jgi:DNA-binding CsgD family transcriptional regulator
MIYLDLLALDQAQAHLEHALILARAVGSAVWIGSAASALAGTYTAQGDISRSLALLDEILGTDAPMQSQMQRLCWSARGESELARGDAQAALSIAERLITARHAQSGAIVRLEKLRGEALSTLGRHGEAELVLLAAREAAQAQQTPSWLWRLHRTLGNVYQAQGRRSDAMRAYAAARAVVQAIANDLAETELRHEVAARALATLPQPAAPSPARALQQQFGGLTAREREVAILIAQGHANRVIAERLCVGVRTVEAHITRILTKLGFESRAQIAVWTVRQGLVESAETE